MQKKGGDKEFADVEILPSPVLSFPTFSLSDVLCDPTDLIWRKGIPFEAMTGRTALHQTVSYLRFSGIFLGYKANARRSVHSPQVNFITTLIISDRLD